MQLIFPIPNISDSRIPVLPAKTDFFFFLIRHILKMCIFFFCVPLPHKANVPNDTCNLSRHCGVQSNNVEVHT